MRGTRQDPAAAGLFREPSNGTEDGKIERNKATMEEGFGGDSRDCVERGSAYIRERW